MDQGGDWVEEAASWPVAFAQVREDPLIDLEVADVLGARDIVMVASGGCTAACLFARPATERLLLVDPNPAQVALSRLKLRLLGRPLSERLVVTGREGEPGRRRELLESSFEELGLAEDALGDLGLVSALGVDQAGRYERVFHRLRVAFGDALGEVEALLGLEDIEEQSRRVAPGTVLGDVWDRAFEESFGLEGLVRIFGEEATRNRVRPFAVHFATRSREELGLRLGRGNPYVSQVLLGRDALGGERAPWLSCRGGEGEVRCEVGGMLEVLGSLGAGSVGMVHLSNILDWLSESRALEVLEAARRVVRRGGGVVVRQLNSSLDIVGLGGGWVWDEGWGRRLWRGDRSYFYRAVHVGVKV